MKDSYQMMIEELGDVGIGPLAHVRGPRRSRFAKSHDAAEKSPFDQLVDDLVIEIRKARAENTRRAEARQRFAKCCAELDIMYKALPAEARAPRRKEQKPNANETVAKAFAALQTDASLNAEQRGRLMLRLSSIFAKSAPAADLAKVERAIALLKRARALKLGGAEADEWIARLEAAVARGELEPSDTLVLEDRLCRIRDHLRDHLKKEADHGER